MVLTTEEFGDIDGPAPDDIEQILNEDAFGKFAILARSEDDFIQAGNDWSPSEECTAFLKSHDSDPWVLEHRDAESGRLFRASGNVTLGQVVRVFLSYLAGETEWWRGFEWAPAA